MAIKTHTKDDGTQGECRANKRGCPKGQSEEQHQYFESRVALKEHNERAFAEAMEKEHSPLSGKRTREPRVVGTDEKIKIALAAEPGPEATREELSRWSEKAQDAYLSSWRDYPKKPPFGGKKENQEFYNAYRSWSNRHNTIEKSFNKSISRMRKEFPAPPRDVSGVGSLWGLRVAQKMAIQNENAYLGISDQDRYADYYGANAEVSSIIDNALNHRAAGTLHEVPDPVDDKGNSYSTSVSELKIAQALRDPGSNQNLYAVTGFPEKELKKAFEKNGVTNVSVSPFNNGREWGIAYTVIQPDGNTRTFSLYEHRNHDSLVVNGMENWNPETIPYGPYSQSSKYDFFAEHSNGDWDQAADTLAFFLKEAQKGELPKDDELAARCERLDWNAIMEKNLGEVWVDFNKRNGLSKNPDTDPLGTDDPRKLGF